MIDSYGHKRPDCDGDWISIGTFTDPDLHLCPKCRATRRIREGSGDDFAPPPTLAPAQATATPRGISWRTLPAVAASALEYVAAILRRLA